MKKVFGVLLVLAIVLAVAMEVVLPRFVSGMLKDLVVNSTHATQAEISLSSSPNAKIVLGDVQKVYGTATACEIGDLEFQALTVDGEKVQVDVPEILFPSQNLTDKQRTEKILKSAKKIEVSGIVTEDGLKKFIENKVDDMENISVKITPQEVTAVGKVKFMGRDADVDVAGMFVVDDGSIYFRATKLDFKNTLVRNVQIDRFLGDVKVLDSSTLPLGLKFSSVQMRDGDILITAEKN